MQLNVNKNILAILSFFIALTGCASNGSTENKPSSSPVITAATGNNGTIVFFRKNKIRGAAVGLMIDENEVELGKLASGNYFVADVVAGTHQFEAQTESRIVIPIDVGSDQQIYTSVKNSKHVKSNVLNIEVAPGQVYYVQGTISTGVPGHPRLESSDAATFDSVKAKLKLSTPLKPAKNN